MEQIEEMLAKGMSQADIAKELGVTRQAIYSRLNYPPIRQKKDDKIKHLHSLGLSIPEIANQLNYTYSGTRTALRRLKLLPQKHTPKKTQIEELWKKGYTINDITGKIGVSYSYAIKVLARLGLSPHKEKDKRRAMFILLRSKGYTLKEISDEIGVSILTLTEYEMMKKKNKDKTRTYMLKRVPADLWDKFKIKAIIKQTTLEEYLIELIKKEVEEK